MKRFGKLCRCTIFFTILCISFLSADPNSPLKKPDDTYKAKPHSAVFIEDFNHTMQQLVNNSPVLLRCLSVKSKLGASSAYFKIVNSFAKELNVPDTITPAVKISNAIYKVADYLNTNRYIDALATTTAKYLVKYYDGNSNSSTLAQQYVTDLNEFANAVDLKSTDDSSCILALSKGLVKFLSNLGIYTIDRAPEWAYIFADDLYIATGQPLPTTEDSEFTTGFNRAVYERVITTSNLPRAFILRSKSGATRSYYNIVSSFATQLGVPDPVTPAKKISNAIQSVYDCLTVPKYLHAVSTTTAKYLLKYAHANLRGVPSLAQGYADSLTNTINRVPLTSDEDDEFIKALSEGLVGFLTSLGVYSVDLAPNWARMFADQLYAENEGAH